MVYFKGYVIKINQGLF